MRGSKPGFFVAHKLKYILLLFIVAICGCEGCFKQTKTPPDWTTYLSDQKGTVLSPTPEKQLIVFIKPGTSREAFNTFLDTGIVKHKDSALKIISVCGSCDSTLLMLEGSGVEAFINGEVAKGGSSSKTKAILSGENNFLYFTTNKRISFDVLPKDFTGNKEYSNYSYQDSITLAVFDTGIKPELFQGYMASNITDACIPGATNGWNFFSWTNNWKDDNIGLHGTIVSRFIIDEVEQYKKTKVNILPVKIFNEEGLADLYTILCGFAYASHSGADMINASFGFYESKNKFRQGDPISDTTTSALLKNFVSSYLTQKNILLICAAGNKSDDDSTIRNLDEINFFPASLAASLPNIIPVTTVGNPGNGRMVSPNQNFSASVVQLGVDADHIDSSHFGFINPINPGSNFTIAGSSFAAPIAAGKMAAYFSVYKEFLKRPDTTITASIRDSIFNRLFSIPANAFLQTDPALLKSICGGKVILRGNEVAAKIKGRKFIRGFEDRGLRIIRR
ncbi:MAG: S8 family serine peptidase [Chitinophagaceae bacterium]|nr:S8 family serine peptidase [Chitinophagaceae bacterium]